MSSSLNQKDVAGLNDHRVARDSNNWERVGFCSFSVCIDNLLLLDDIPELFTLSELREERDYGRRHDSGEIALVELLSEIKISNIRSIENLDLRSRNVF